MIKGSNHKDEIAESRRWCECGISQYDEWAYEGDPKSFCWVGVNGEYRPLYGKRMVVRTHQGGLQKTSVLFGTEVFSQSVNDCKSVASGTIM